MAEMGDLRLTEAEFIEKIAWMVRDWAICHRPLSERETIEMEDAIPLATSLLDTVSARIRETPAPTEIDHIQA